MRSTIERFRPFPDTVGRYGAPLGRHSISLDPGLAPDDLAAAGPAWEYDAGGAYWGLPSRGAGPVWAVWRRGHGTSGVCYVRAHSAWAAKRKALGVTHA